LTSTLNSIHLNVFGRSNSAKWLPANPVIPVIKAFFLEAFLSYILLLSTYSFINKPRAFIFIDHKYFFRQRNVFLSSLFLFLKDPIVKFIPLGKKQIASADDAASSG